MPSVRHNGGQQKRGEGMAEIVNECQLAGRPGVTELHMMLLLLLQRHFIILTARRPTDRPTDSVHRICPFHCMIFHSFNFVSIMRARLPRFFSDTIWIRWEVDRGT